MVDFNQVLEKEKGKQMAKATTKATTKAKGNNALQAEWAAMDLEAEAAQDKEVESNFQNEFWKAEPGEHAVRFLPRLTGMSSNIKIIYEHYYDVSDEERVRFVCPRKQSMGKERCPLCDQADKLKRSRSAVDNDRAKDFYPQFKAYANIIVRDEEELGPRVYGFGKTVYEKIKKIKTSKHGGGDYTNPNPDGFDVVIDRTGTGKTDTRYDAYAARTETPLSDDEDQMREWILGQHSLDAYAVILDSMELKALMRGGKEDLKRVQTQLERGGSNVRKLNAGGKRRTAQSDAEDGPTIIDVEYEDEDEDEDAPL